MKKIRILGLLCIFLLVIFFFIDTKTYYYGFGHGILSSKIPHRFSILFAGSDLGNQGVVIKETEMGAYQILNNKESSISITNRDNKVWLKHSQDIDIKKFIGYWFKKDVLVVKILDVNDNERYVMIYEESTNRLHPEIIYEELKQPPSKYDNLTYIDLDKSLAYFKRLKLIKNSIFVLVVILSLYCLRLYYLSRKKPDGSDLHSGR